MVRCYNSIIWRKKNVWIHGVTFDSDILVFKVTFYNYSVSKSILLWAEVICFGPCRAISSGKHSPPNVLVFQTYFRSSLVLVCPLHCQSPFLKILNKLLLLSIICHGCLQVNCPEGRVTISIWKNIFSWIYSRQIRSF